MGRLRLIIALLIAGVSALTYFLNTQQNPITGEKQRVGSMTFEQEVAMGRQSAPGMAREMGGISRNAEATQLVKRTGQRIVANSVAAKSPYARYYDFHLLADPNTINAFALPGGQIFITEGLLKLLRTEDELAAVLGHEIGHVIGRHSAERLAQSGAWQGAVMGVAVGTGDMTTTQAAQQVAALTQMKYGREDELEADKFGACLAREAGYNPAGMIGVMEILDKASRGARQPEMLSTHPNPGTRIQDGKRVLANLQAECVWGGTR